MRGRVRWIDVLFARLLVVGASLTFGFGWPQEAGGSQVDDSVRLRLNFLRAVESRNAERLVEAAERLADAGEAGLRELSILLKHESPDVVEFAAAVLSQIPHPDAVRALIGRIEEETSFGRRENLRRLLSAVRHGAATEVFLNAWLSSPADDVRTLAGEALAQIGDETVVRFMEGILEGPADGRLIRRAMRVLGAVRNPSVAPYLGSVLLRTRSAPLLVASSVALGEIGTSEALGYLLRAFNQLPPAYGGAIAQGLSFVSREEAMPILRDVIQGSWPDPLRENAALALRNFAREDIVNLIEQQLAVEASTAVREALQSSRERILARPMAQGR